MRRVGMAMVTVIGVLAALASSAAAAEMTLDDCINLALEKRATIIQAKGAESVASAEKRSALGAFLPSVYASYSYSKGKETKIDPPNEQYGAYEVVLDTTVIGADTAVDAVAQPILSSLALTDEQDHGPSKSLRISGSMDLINVSNWFNLAAAGAGRVKAELDVLRYEQDLVYAVKTAYYAYLASEENVDVQREAVRRADEQLKLIESRFELGSASKSDVLKQKVQFGNDRLGMLNAENGVVNAKANLAYTIGLDPREEHQFSSTYQVREYTGTLDDAIGYGLDNNPSLLGQQRSVSEANHYVNAARSYYLPSLSASVDWSKFNGTQSYPQTFDYSSNTLTWGLQLSFTVFDGFIREQRVTNARVSRNNAMAGLADVRNGTVADIKTAYLDIQKLKEQKAVSQENVAAAEEDLRITQEKYNLGAATILDLLDAQVSLKQAQVALIQVDFDLNLAVAQLEKAMGKR